MEILDKACRSCMHYNSETKSCSLWKVPIGNENTQTCGRFELKRKFKNFGKIKLMPYHKITYEYERFKVVDTRYGNLTVYEELKDDFYFTKYLVLEASQKRYSVDYQIHFWRSQPHGKNKSKFTFKIEAQYNRFEYHYSDDRIVVRSNEEYEGRIPLKDLSEVMQIKEAIIQKNKTPIPSKYVLIEAEMEEEYELVE